MFEAWGQIVFRRRRLVLAVAGLAVVAAAAWGLGVFAHLQTTDSFTAPGSQSVREASLATRTFGRDEGDVVVVYSSPKAGSTYTPAFRSAVTSTLAALPHSRVVSYETYWSTGSRQFISPGGRRTYAVIELAGRSDTQRIASYNAISSRLAAPGLTTHAGGLIPTEQAINHEVTSDIGRAEAFSMPVLLILLLFIFGGLVAASLPLAIGGIAILGSFSALRLLALVTPVAIYSINITTILGVGLAIDYGLFVVGRFREELNKSGSTEAALARTMATAGRTVAVSGVTVAVALAGLTLFPQVFLRSMGYGGVATVLVDMLAALTVLPALLAVLGPRVNALRVRKSAGRGTLTAEESGGWYRLARSVMRRPIAYAAVIVVVLLALGAPFLHIAWGGVDARVLPASAQPRIVTEQLSQDFPGNPTAPIESLVTFSGPVTRSSAGGAELASYVSKLAKIPGVTGAAVTGVRGDIARVDLRYGSDPTSAGARGIVTQVRAISLPPGAHALVGGQTAQLSDELSSLGSVLPWMALVMACATFVLLFLAFGSVVLPLKAIVMNLISLTATFGVIVWIFQEGHLSGLLQFLPTGTIDPSMPILMLAIIFGLSMDYEVFLLSRIRERYDVTGDNTAAVAGGLQRTGGVITSAALLLVIVIGAFSASGITFIKLLGVGMIVALIVDASIVRVMLVPATMRLLGRANWWAPGPLRKLYARYGIREGSQAGGETERDGSRSRRPATVS